MCCSWIELVYLKWKKILSNLWLQTICINIYDLHVTPHAQSRAKIQVECMQACTLALQGGAWVRINVFMRAQRLNLTSTSKSCQRKLYWRSWNFCSSKTWERVRNGVKLFNHLIFRSKEWSEAPAKILLNI